MDEVDQLDSRRERLFTAWLTALEKRHLADLTFAQVSSALRALSSIYVERRARMRDGAALDGAGKRAAFALFYGPLHYMLVQKIVHALSNGSARADAFNRSAPHLVDLGCGTGAAGAGWASAASSASAPRLIGVDRHPWAVEMAAETYRAFGLEGRTKRVDVTRAPLPDQPCSIVAAFLFNELEPSARDGLIERLLRRLERRRGDRLLIIEPIAASATPWWRQWREAVEHAGGRADEWRFRVELPAIVAKLDRAAGLDHRELTGRSLWLS